MSNDILNQWLQLNEQLMGMPETEVQRLLEVEKAGRARLRVMLRLYHRLSKLRSQREKRELATHAKA